jgi:hypothetical protein
MPATNLVQFLAELPTNQRVIFYTSRQENGQILGCKVENPQGTVCIGFAASFTGDHNGTSPGWNDELAIGLIDAAQHGGIWEEQRIAKKEAERRQGAWTTRRKNDAIRRQAEKDRVTRLHEERLNEMTKKPPTSLTGSTENTGGPSDKP